ncbi:hypothetical protein QOZ80_6BG0458890 [Eleusine coracana subsp. coracana]|nr:hypothetical protein QOZ80_6BG0458890 [Eleusine coracana subsp. coracana]
MMGSSEAYETDWERMPVLPLEELLKDLSVEEQVRVHRNLHECERIARRCNKNSPQPPQVRLERERQCNNRITSVTCHALRYYNAKHPDAGFDAVRSLTECSVHFRGELWYHINFWARSRRSNKIKCFFAEVHYKPPSRSSVAVHYKRPTNRSVCSNPPVPAPEAEVHDRPSASTSVCLDQPVSVPEAQVCHRPSATHYFYPVLPPIPIVEVCTIIEEPLERNRRSCAFCPGSEDILHPRGGRKFVCGNDKDRFVQQFHFSPYKYKTGPEFPFPWRQQSTTVKRK